MKLLQHNPYRLLGVYANSPTKERLANSNRIKAFVKVGKAVTFPLDLPQYMPSVDRTEQTVIEAESELTLPKDQLRYAQFWFFRVTPFDEVAFNHLLDGNFNKAEEIWHTKETSSSLQNVIVFALMRGEYSMALCAAEKLYGNAEYVQVLSDAVLGNGTKVSSEELALNFLDGLSAEIGYNAVLRNTSNDSWKKHIREKAVSPLLESIQDAIDKAYNLRGKNADESLKAGEALQKETKYKLLQLKQLLTTSDLQYQMIADKLGLEILQCSINYYNKSEDPYAARKALPLAKYAASIVVGSAAKERCKTNLDTIQKYVDELPPEEVAAEYDAVKEKLRKYNQLPDEICHAVSLLNNTKPHLQAIKQKLGANNKWYISLSTDVVNRALYNIIEEVNAEQKVERINSTYLKLTISSAWSAMQLAETFDMDISFRNSRFKENRDILQRIWSNMCLGPVFSNATSRSRPAASYSTRTSNSDSSGGKDVWIGCLVLIFGIAIILFCVGQCSSSGSSRHNDTTYVSDVDTTMETPIDTGFASYDAPTEYNSDEQESEYADNQLETGAKPYSAYYGKSKTGSNYLDFNTTEGTDYIIIVKKYNSQKVVNHVYIRGGDTKRMYLPNGTFSIYFYSGKGWNPNKQRGKVVGAFEKYESIQKDEPVSIHDQYGEYTLYPVQDGNLHLEAASDDEAF